MRRQLVYVLTFSAALLSQRVKAEHVYNQIEEFLSRDAIVVVAKLSEAGPLLKTNPLTPQLFKWAKFKVEKVLSGKIEGEFQIEYATVVKPGTSCLLYVTAGDVPGQFSRFSADNSIEALEPTEYRPAKQIEAHLHAVAEIIRIERIEDAETRNRAQRNLFREDNLELQQYAVRALVQGPKSEETIIDMLTSNAWIKVRADLLHELFFYRAGRKEFPEKLIGVCLEIAAKDADKEVRRAAVSALHGMCQTGLLGPKHSYDVVLPKMVEIFAGESDSLVAKELAIAITVIGQIKHRKLLDDLNLNSLERQFYVDAIIKHWKAEGDSALNIQAGDFEYLGPKGP